MWESTAEEGSWQVRGLSFALRAPGSHGRLREGEGRLCFNEILKGTLEGPRLDSRDQGGGGEAGGGLDQSRDHEKGGRRGTKQMKGSEASRPVRAKTGSSLATAVSPVAAQGWGHDKYLGKFLLFFFKDCIYLFLNRGEGRERGRETSMCGSVSRAPYREPGPQPRPVP